ncbi:hypothetical protein G7046_g1197 [Stylonectria norvegica]|nr:hypothetical protein G7046_g1197 [Stylonectria norvegica]
MSSSRSRPTQPIQCSELQGIRDQQPPVSPMADDGRLFDVRWKAAANKEYTFTRATDRLSADYKLQMMQEYFWVAMFRYVEYMGCGWGRNQMNGIIDWYRKCFWLPTWMWEPDTASTRQLVDATFRDGFWLTVLLTSPWATCPALQKHIGENRKMIRDSRGRLVLTNGRFKQPTYSNTDHMSDDALQAFLEDWVTAANQWEVPRQANGDPVLPYLAGGY